MKSERKEINLTDEQREKLARHGRGVDARLYCLYINGEPMDLYIPEQAVGGGYLTHKGYCNIQWANTWNVMYSRKQIEQLIGKIL